MYSKLLKTSPKEGTPTSMHFTSAPVPFLMTYSKLISPGLMHASPNPWNTAVGTPLGTHSVEFFISSGYYGS